MIRSVPVERAFVAWTLAALFALVSGFAPAQAQTTASSMQHDPLQVIAARRELMNEMQRLIEPIDLYTVDGNGDPTALSSAAFTIAALLAPTPFLFPPDTNIYDANAQLPETSALPVVWEEPTAFAAMATAAVAAANRLAALNGDSSASDLHAAAVGLRAACDACHARYLVPYKPAVPSDEDTDFDFDAFFGDAE